jgi:hypothetical protein
MPHRILAPRPGSRRSSSPPRSFAAHAVGCALVGGFFGAVAAPGVAHAGWPEDVSLSGMTTQGGVPQVDTAVLSEAYRQLVLEVGTNVGTSSIPGPHTLGTRGFEVAVEAPISISLYRGDAEDPDAWMRGTGSESSSYVMTQPGLTLRKGLPMGLEFGFTGRWVGMSHQGVIGGFVRAGLLDGYQPAPDLTVHVGYNAYIGNPELDLGTLNLGVTLGGKAKVGGVEKAKAATFAPFLDVSLLTVTAVPKVDADVRATLGAVAFGRKDTDTDPSNNGKALTTGQFSGGIQLNAGQLMVRINGGYSLKSTAYGAVAVGVTY